MKHTLALVLVTLTLFFCTPAIPADSPHFTDITEASGVTFIHRTGAQGGWHYIENMGSGCALFDSDSDGDLDLYLVNGANLPGQAPEGVNALYRNDTAKAPDIRFFDVTEHAGVPGRGYGMGCTVADYDNDGDMDLYVTGYEENILYRNDGDGTFTDITKQAGVAVGGWCAGAAFFDSDNDGDLDLYAVRYLTYDVLREPPCHRVGVEGDSVRINCGPEYFRGAPDLLYRNDGDGTFTDITKQAGIFNPTGKGLGVVTLDYDGDGDTDLYIANDTTPNFLYRNDGKGPTGQMFTEVGTESGVAYSAIGRPQSGMGVDAGDIDGDGLPDLIVTNFSYEPNACYHNQGQGLLTDAITQVGLAGHSMMPLGFGTNFLDFDNDGDLDLFVANGHIFHNVAHFSPTESYAQPDQLFQNDGSGTFKNISAASGLTAPAAGRGSAVGDLDSDGDLDLVVLILHDRPRIYQNNVGNRNHWLALKLVGGVGEIATQKTGAKEGGGAGNPKLETRNSELSYSNRSAIGTRISVTAGGRTQTREVRSQSSYLSASDIRLHFGLSASNRVDRVEIRWPSGRVDTLQNIRTDQVLLINE